MHTGYAYKAWISDMGKGVNVPDKFRKSGYTVLDIDDDHAMMPLSYPYEGDTYRVYVELHCSWGPDIKKAAKVKVYWWMPCELPAESEEAAKKRIDDWVEYKIRGVLGPYSDHLAEGADRVLRAVTDPFVAEKLRHWKTLSRGAKNMEERESGTV